MAKTSIWQVVRLFSGHPCMTSRIRCGTTRNRRFIKDLLIYNVPTQMHPNLNKKTVQADPVGDPIVGSQKSNLYTF